jgi:hypothetical protein
MTVKKWAVIGVIFLGLAAALAGRMDATLAATTGLIGFLKDDSE